eukprot:252481-Pleurochrysis_carterae.AAC.2
MHQRPAVWLKFAPSVRVLGLKGRARALSALLLPSSARRLAWIWVTVLLLMAQSLFVLWTMLMIGSDIAMVSAVNISARG